MDYFAGTGTSTGDGALFNAETGWINAVIGNRNDGVQLPPRLRGRVGSSMLIVGGVRLSQTRTALGPCSLAEVRSVYGSCHTNTGPSLEPYGVAANFVPADATNSNVTSAFYPSVYDGKTSFQLWLDVGATRTANQNILRAMDLCVGKGTGAAGGSAWSAAEGSAY